MHTAPGTCAQPYKVLGEAVGATEFEMPRALRSPQAGWRRERQAREKAGCSLCGDSGGVRGCAAWSQAQRSWQGTHLASPADFREKGVVWSWLA